MPPETDLDGKLRYDEADVLNTGAGTYPYYDIGDFEYYPTAPIATSFLINNGAPSTTLPAVRLHNICTGGPTHYMVSESSSFVGATLRLVMPMNRYFPQPFYPP